MNYKLIIFFLLISAGGISAQFAPSAGQKGTSAMHKDSSAFIGWAKSCKVIRGLQDISDSSLGYASAGDSSMATGKAGSNGVVSLGDGGIATLYFQYPIMNGSGYDFAVFENSFDDKFLELAFVEVSSDGVNFIRFKSTSLSDTTKQKEGFDFTDPTKINNLAGKYRALFGTPFDLEELKGTPGLDVNSIKAVRIIDAVGSLNNEYVTRDGDGRKINDPWPTPFPSSGFDLDAVGVIHWNLNSGIENIESKNFSLYPNPIKQGENIQLNYDSKHSTVQIFAINGKLEQEQNFSGSSSIIQTEKLVKGIYFIRIKTDNKIVSKKIVITE